MKRKKITVVGVGRVGETLAHILAKKALGDLVLVDVVPNLAAGKALDLMELRPIDGSDVNIVGTTSFAETSGSDVVVVTSGMPRKPGESREDLLKKNIAIVKPVTEEIKKTSPNAILVVVANPLDTMTWVSKKVSGWPKNRVFGMAGILDTARGRRDREAPRLQRLLLAGCGGGRDGSGGPSGRAPHHPVLGLSGG
jgi:malate dehydrogenase